MFESSVAGELYDPERFGSYYTPQGVQLTNRPAPSGPSQVSKTPEPVVAETTTTPTEEKVETETEGGEKPSADQILKMIRERKAQ